MAKEQQSGTRRGEGGSGGRGVVGDPKNDFAVFTAASVIPSRYSLIAGGPLARLKSVIYTIVTLLVSAAAPVAASKSPPASPSLSPSRWEVWLPPV